MSKQEPAKKTEAPATQKPAEITYNSRDGQQVKLTFDVVRKYLISGKAELVTDQEIMMYIGTCKARGLNPFKRDCYLVKYTEGDPAATIVSIDYFRARAKAQPDCRGWNAGVVVVDKSGEVVKRKGAITYEGDVLIGGWFEGHVEGWTEPREWSVPLKAYVKKTRQGEPTRFWQTDNQGPMISKVAEAQGLRFCWPDEFQGLSVEGDQVIDVTPPEPIKTPKAIDKKAASNEQQEKRPVTQNDTKSNAPADPATVGGNDSPLSQEEIAILKIDSFIKDNFPEASALSPLIKGLDPEAQSRVCTYYNDRKREVLG